MKHNKRKTRIFPSPMCEEKISLSTIFFWRTSDFPMISVGFLQNDHTVSFHGKFGSGAGKINLIFWIEMDLKHYIRGYKLCLYLKRKNIFCEKDILPVEDVLKKGLMSKEELCLPRR